MIQTRPTPARQAPAWLMVLVLLLCLGGIGALTYYLYHSRSQPKEIVQVVGGNPPANWNPPPGPGRGGRGRGGPPGRAGGGGNGLAQVMRRFTQLPDGISPINGGQNDYRIVAGSLVVRVTGTAPHMTFSYFPIWPSMLSTDEYSLLMAANNMTRDPAAAAAAHVSAEQIRRLTNPMPTITLSATDEAELQKVVADYEQATGAAQAQAEKGVLAAVKAFEAADLPAWKKQAAAATGRIKQVLAPEQLTEYRQWVQNGRHPPRPTTGPATAPTATPSTLPAAHPLTAAPATQG